MGGLRPIGLFPSPIRVWMRCRFHIARDWERRNSRPCLYGGPGMGAQRAAWVAAFKLEEAGRDKDHTDMSLLDLTKAFELVPHDVLIAAAVEYGYPLFPQTKGGTTGVGFLLALYRITFVDQDLPSWPACLDLPRLA